MKKDLVKRANLNGLHIIVQDQVMRDTTHIISLVDTRGVASRTESYMLGVALGKYIVSTQCMYHINNLFIWVKG